MNDNGTLPNVFVYVKAGAENYTFAPPADAVTLDQDGCMYKPHVLGIMAGQTLKIVSSDATTHNIHPMPKDNAEWNMSQAPGAAPIEQKFARPEIMVPVKCNQHPWMRAWIGVTSNPFFAVSGSDGTFTIKGLPPGDYTIEAWTATFGNAGTEGDGRRQRNQDRRFQVQGVVKNRVPSAGSAVRFRTSRWMAASNRLGEGCAWGAPLACSHVNEGGIRT